MTYAKLISQTTISTTPPREATIGGAQVVGALPEPYLNSQGWYRLEQTPAPETQEGYHAEPRYAYDDAEHPTVIIQTWVEVENPPPPPRTISKFKLKMAIADAGFLPQFEQLLAAVEVKPGYSGAAAFADAVTLDEDNPKFVSAVEIVKTEFGMTDEQIEAILAASVAE